MICWLLEKGPCSIESIKIWETGMGCKEESFNSHYYRTISVECIHPCRPEKSGLEMGTNLEYALHANFPLIDRRCYIECLYISWACLIIHRVTKLAGSWVMMIELQRQVQWTRKKKSNKRIVYIRKKNQYIFFCDPHFYCLTDCLETKRRLLYLKTQSVPRCKHFSSRL